MSSLDDTVRYLTLADHEALLANVFANNGVSKGNAAIFVANCVGCERDDGAGRTGRALVPADRCLQRLRAARARGGDASPSSNRR